MQQRMINGVKTHYEKDRAVIRFSGDVVVERILDLCDEIDCAVEDYFYKRVLIRIDSPGGEAKSLLCFINHLKKWRSKGVTIGTQALTSCCSAAAYMLSLGDLGHRSAMPDSLLLYHNARISAANAALTDDRLDVIQWELKTTDGQLITHLLRHLHGHELPAQQFDILNELVCCLPDPKSDIDTALLGQVCDQHSAKQLKAVNACLEPVEKIRMRRELYRCITDKLRSEAKRHGNKTIEELTSCPNEKQNPQTERQILAWLYGRYEECKKEFARDEYMRPEKAVKHGLIDRIGDECI